MKFATNINLSKNELQNARLQNLSTAPSSPVAGQMYFDTTTHQAYIYDDNSSSWLAMSAGSANAFGTVTDGSTNAVADAPNDTLTLSTANNILGIAVTAVSDTVTFTVNQGNIDHGSIGGLSDDDHTQYALLAGRSGGQVLKGDTASGGHLFLQSTANATKGKVYFGGSTSGKANVDETTGDVTGNTFASTVSTGTAPLTITSTTKVSNLNVDQVDGADATTTPTASAIPIANGSNKLAAGWISEVLALADLTDVSGTTGSGTTVMLAMSPTLTASGGVSLNAGSGRITSVSDPTSAQDAATKAYVDAVKTGLDVKDSVRVATAAALPSNTRSGNVLTASSNGSINGTGIDSVTDLAVNDRVLVKNEATGAHNGLYYVSAVGDASNPWTLTRSTDADANAEVTAGLYTFVEEGTTNADSGWVLTTNNPITVNTTSLSFVQFSGAGQITAGAGLTKTGNTLDVVGTTDRITVNADSVDIAATYVGQTSITTLGTIGTGTWQGTAVGTSYGGTGATSVAGAKTNLGFMTRYATDIGDGSTTAIVVTHNLGTRDVSVTIREAGSPYAVIMADVEMTTTNTVTITFSTAPTTSQYRVIVIG